VCRSHCVLGEGLHVQRDLGIGRPVEQRHLLAEDTDEFAHGQTCPLNSRTDISSETGADTPRSPSAKTMLADLPPSSAA
jgi:hypothetical protein